jgi:hypothetical protein
LLLAKRRITAGAPQGVHHHGDDKGQRRDALGFEVRSALKPNQPTHSSEAMLMAGVKAQPVRQFSGDRTTAIQGDRLPDFIAPFRMPEKDRNQGSDIPSDGETHRISRVLDADFNGRSI